MTQISLYFVCVFKLDEYVKIYNNESAPLYYLLLVCVCVRERERERERERDLYMHVHSEYCSVHSTKHNYEH